MTTCSESGQVRKEAAIRSLCRASESIERTGAILVPGHVVQKSPVKARLSNLIYPLRNAARWRCLGIDGYVVQEAAVLLLELLQLKRLVSLGWGNEPLFVSGLVDW